MIKDGLARKEPAPRFFYGVQGTPFVDAANAWWWTLDCLEARAEGGRGCSSLGINRPCDPDDVMNALRRLDLPAVHARTVVAWGKKREIPPEETEARRFWDETMRRLTIVLRAKGIVQATDPVPDIALIEAMGRIGDDTRPADPPGRFAPDFRMIVGTGGSRLAVA